MKLNRHNVIARLFIPLYDELALFLMSLTFILLFFTHEDLRTGSCKILFDRFDPRSYIGLLIFVLGILFSLYHVFTNRKKTKWEKIAMLFFAVVVNGSSGIAAARHLLEGSQGMLLVFPILNIANGVLLLLLYRCHIIDESSIVDDNASLLQVILGSVVVLIIFIVCRFVFQIYWAITFSICVTYASNVNRAIQGLVSRFFRSKRFDIRP